jgi:glutaredoxin 3
MCMSLASIARLAACDQTVTRIVVVHMSTTSDSRAACTNTNITFNLKRYARKVLVVRRRLMIVRTHKIRNSLTLTRKLQQELDHSMNSAPSAMPSRQHIRDFVQRQNASHLIVVWSKSNNPYGAATKKLFESIPEEDVVIHELDIHPHGNLIEGELGTMTGQRSLPIIFMKKRHLGGYDDVRKAHRSGNLRRLSLSAYSSSLQASVAIKESRKRTAESLSPHKNFVWEEQPQLSPSLEANMLFRSPSELPRVQLRKLNQRPSKGSLQYELGMIARAIAIIDPDNDVKNQEPSIGTVQLTSKPFANNDSNKVVGKHSHRYGKEDAKDLPVKLHPCTTMGKTSSSSKASTDIKESQKSIEWVNQSQHSSSLRDILFRTPLLHRGKYI